jgi:hypothetical protein
MESVRNEIESTQKQTTFISPFTLSQIHGLFHVELIIDSLLNLCWKFHSIHLNCNLKAPDSKKEYGLS